MEGPIDVAVEEVGGTVEVGVHVVEVRDGVEVMRVHPVEDAIVL